MKIELTGKVLYVIDAREYKDRVTGLMKKPEHKSLVVFENNILENGNIRPNAEEVKCMLDKSEVPTGNIRCELKVSAYVKNDRGVLNIKILKVLK